ncbi:MAG TPA: hypothetical protein VKT73_08550 [Xanthobacteraceae bacterium]|nr:hypothetical protein [Xanthobacteraceae bacterium]
MSANENKTAAALTTIIGVLTPLSSEERRRTVNAAMTFLGEDTDGPGDPHKPGKPGADEQGQPNVAKWMKQYGVNREELEHAFQFKDDGSFEVLDVPGKSKRERTANTYILCGLGKFLATNQRNFDDAYARALCDTFGCYDQANHSAILQGHRTEFTGDKTKGYTMTPQGLKRGAALVKELAEAAA